MVEAKSTVPITRSLGIIQRKEFYGDVKINDVVFILTDEGVIETKNTHYTFLCHARNTETGKEWLELWGGRRGYESCVAVLPSAVHTLSR